MPKLPGQPGETEQTQIQGKESGRQQENQGQGFHSRTPDDAEVRNKEGEKQGKETDDRSPGCGDEEEGCDKRFPAGRFPVPEKSRHKPDAREIHDSAENEPHRDYQ
jgi:hypothetical protein